MPDPVTLGALGGAGLSAAGSIIGGVGASRRARRARRRVRRLVGFAEQQAEAEAKRIQESEEFQLARDFYLSYGREGVPAWMRDVAADQLRAASAARGVAYGGAGARQESLALTSMAERGRQAAAPALLQLAEAPLRFKEMAFQHYLGRTGLGMGVTKFGPDPLEIAGQALGAGVQGALGGAQIGLGLTQLGQGGRQPGSTAGAGTSAVQPATGYNSPQAVAAQNAYASSQIRPASPTSRMADTMAGGGRAATLFGAQGGNPTRMGLGMGFFGGQAALQAGRF